MRIWLEFSFDSHHNAFGHPGDPVRSVGKNQTHHEVLFFHKHQVGCVGVIDAVRFIDRELFLLCFK